MNAIYKKRQLYSKQKLCCTLEHISEKYNNVEFARPRKKLNEQGKLSAIDRISDETVVPYPTSFSDITAELILLLGNNDNDTDVEIKGNGENYFVLSSHNEANNGTVQWDKSNQPYLYKSVKLCSNQTFENTNIAS